MPLFYPIEITVSDKYTYSSLGIVHCHHLTRLPRYLGGKESAC